MRKREAKRRLMDINIKAGQPGTNLCHFTGVASSEKQRGKRPYFYKEKNVGRVGVDLCANRQGGRGRTAVGTRGWNLRHVHHVADHQTAQCGCPLSSTVQQLNSSHSGSLVTSAVPATGGWLLEGRVSIRRATSTVLARKALAEIVSRHR